MAEHKDLPHASGPAGGWGSLRGIAHAYGDALPSPAALRSLGRINKPKGVMCVSCAWPKPANYSAFEFCENGAKATLWELERIYPGCGQTQSFAPISDEK